MTDPSAFVIEELTGSQRRVSLRGRALPFRGVGFGRDTRVKTTFYPGNPEGTQQILGRELKSTSIKGRWSDRFIGGQVEVTGFDTPTLAQHVVSIFEDLVESANDLHVQWGGVVRTGVMIKFDPSYLRVQDIDWAIEFEWRAAEVTVPHATTVLTPPPNLLQALNEMDDELAFEPPFTIPDYSSRILSVIDNIRDRVGSMFDAARSVQRLATTPATILNSVSTLFEDIRDETKTTLRQFSSVPYTLSSSIDRVAEVLTLGAWRGNMARRVTTVRSSAREQRNNIEAELSLNALAIVRVPADTTLRQLSVTYYGTPDSWQLIADVNGIAGSVVPAGMQVIIPRHARPVATIRVL